MSENASLTDPDKPRRILLIEDSEVDRLWLRHSLAGERIEVAEAADGLSGLECCQENPPDLILLDLGLPLCDGFEILRRLQEDCRSSSIPVIVVSATADPQEKVRGLDLGAVDYVTKPYDLIELQARIRVALRSKRLQELLEQRAHVDGLTGLANRLALEERLATEWALHLRHGGSLALLIIDLDHFKRVNDAYGHATGDEVLRRVAEALRASVRTTDLAARYGGEEFVVIAPRCESAGAIKTAQRFRHRLSRSPMILGNTSIEVTASVGVGTVPEQRAEAPADLLAYADLALYRAKSRGRDCVIFSGEAESPLPPETHRQRIQA